MKFGHWDTDNGLEFAKYMNIANLLKTKIFFTAPYSSWQKGGIENANKLIRYIYLIKYILKTCPSTI
ncbi:MAG: hypothetical protein LBV69_10220 [Bacteroidales bacterium]|jgi:IS30 family transposase|nr:hypothetical protein [Bacteroidales bacterium]